MTKSPEHGFTLIEVLISSVIIVPILFAVISTKDVVRNTISANERRADTGDHVRRIARRLRQLVRPGLLSTVKIRATQADVDLATAEEAARFAAKPLGIPMYIPTLDDWISPGNLNPRDNIQFQGADDGLAMNASALTSPRVLEFRIDPNEADNDLDDDGDGIVDEGKLHFQYDGLSFVLLENVESCTFALDDGILLLSLQVARSDASGRIHRASIRQRVYLRNN